MHYTRFNNLRLKMIVCSVKSKFPLISFDLKRKFSSKNSGQIYS
jgi:hypothetical protein